MGAELRRIRLAFPGTAGYIVTRTENGKHIDRFTGRKGILEFSADMENVPFTETIRTNSADSPLGKGTREPIPLTLMLEARNLNVTPSAPLNLNISMQLLSAMK